MTVEHVYITFVQTVLNNNYHYIIVKSQKKKTKQKSN